MQKPYLLRPHPRFPVIFCFCYIIYSEVSHEKLLCNWFHFPKKNFDFQTFLSLPAWSTLYHMYYAFQRRLFSCCQQHGHRQLRLFTIGRSMLSGKVPYRDLFDHKGWYVYFFNYLGACLSSKTTIGLFIIECAFMIINVILLFKITDLISGNRVSEICKSLSVGLMLLLILNFSPTREGISLRPMDWLFSFCLFFLLSNIIKERLLIILRFSCFFMEYVPELLWVFGLIWLQCGEELPLSSF